MAVDTPAKIAIIGAGPIGLEAALYARYLGYDVEVFELRDDCLNVLDWKEHRMFTPFGQNCSPLGLAAIAAQGASQSLPAASDFLTYGQWYEHYLKPLSETDLIAENLRTKVIVQSIGKVELTKTDRPHGEFDRGNWDFRLLLLHMGEQTCAAQSIVAADVVLDCGGRESQPAGHGGIPAVGEQPWRAGTALTHAMPAAESYAGKSVLVVGNEAGAASVVVSLARMNPPARVTWVTRQEREASSTPVPVLAGDPLPHRAEIMAAANQLAASSTVTWWPGTWVEAFLATDENQVVVQLSGEHEGQHTFDAVISQTGHRPDWSAGRELQLDICPITDAPRPFSEWLLKRPSPYSVEYPAPDAAAMITSEPNYYVLGSKSFGRMQGFLYQHGLRQIRDVFSIIGDRTDLDLYRH